MMQVSTIHSYKEALLQFRTDLPLHVAVCTFRSKYPVCIHDIAYIYRAHSIVKCSEEGERYTSVTCNVFFDEQWPDG